MYQAFYGLSEEPFRLSPDVRFCYLHRSFANAKSYFKYAIQRGEGIVLITGQPGTGKTTLIDDMLDELSQFPALKVKIEGAEMGPDDLMRRVAYALGLEPRALDIATLLHDIEAHLEAQSRRFGRSLLIVDEAQALPMHALDALRRLTNLRLDGRPLLQIFLVGQESMKDTIRAPELSQLQQRILCASHMDPLALDETRDYIAHRLRFAGWRGDPRISAGAVKEIFLASRGVPRLINKIMDRLLLGGSLAGLHELSTVDALAALDELRDELLLDGGPPTDRESASAVSAEAAAAEAPVELPEIKDIALENEPPGKPQTKPARPAATPPTTAPATATPTPTLAPTLAPQPQVSRGRPTTSSMDRQPRRPPAASRQATPRPPPSKGGDLRPYWPYLAAGALLIGAVGTYLVMPRQTNGLDPSTLAPTASAPTPGAGPDEAATALPTPTADPGQPLPASAPAATPAEPGTEGQTGPAPLAQTAAAITQSPEPATTAATGAEAATEAEFGGAAVPTELPPGMLSAPAFASAEDPASATASSALAQLEGELQSLGLLPRSDRTGLRINLNTELPFGTSSSRVPEDTSALLDALAKLLAGHPDARVQIIGHTDDIGDADYNKALSAERAAAVRDRLIASGVAAERLTALGRGEEAPLHQPADGPLTRRQRLENRRIELVIAPTADARQASDD